MEQIFESLSIRPAEWWRGCMPEIGQTWTRTIDELSELCCAVSSNLPRQWSLNWSRIAWRRLWRLPQSYPCQQQQHFLPLEGLINVCNEIFPLSLILLFAMAATLCTRRFRVNWKQIACLNVLCLIQWRKLTVFLPLIKFYFPPRLLGYEATPSRAN